MRRNRQQQDDKARLQSELTTALAKPTSEVADEGVASLDDLKRMYHVPKQLGRRWVKLKAAGVTDATAELRCEHGGLTSTSDTRLVDEATCNAAPLDARDLRMPFVDHLCRLRSC